MILVIFFTSIKPFFRAKKETKPQGSRLSTTKQNERTDIGLILKAVKQSGHCLLSTKYFGVIKIDERSHPAWVGYAIHPNPYTIDYINRDLLGSISQILKNRITDSLG